MCLPELDVRLYLLNKAIGPKLIILISLPSTYLLSVAACNTSNFDKNDYLAQYLHYLSEVY